MSKLKLSMIKRGKRKCNWLGKRVFKNKNEYKRKKIRLPAQRLCQEEHRIWYSNLHLLYQRSNPSSDQSERYPKTNKDINKRNKKT